MHQSQRMSDFVWGDIAQARSHRFFVENGSPGFRIDLSCLNKLPVVQQFQHIVIHIHRCLNNFTWTGIGPGRSHRIGHRRRRIAETGITDIVGIEIGIIGREITGNDSVFETDRFESRLPVLDTQFDIFFPFSRQGVIHIKNNRFSRLYQFPFFIPFQFFGFRFQTPAIDISDLLALIFFGGIQHFPIGEIPHPGIE